MKFSFQKKLTIFFSIILIGIVVIGIATFRNNQSIHLTDNLVQHTREVLFQSEELQSAVQDAVLNTRGYIITGDTTFIQRYAKSNNNIVQHTNNLKNLTKDNSTQQLRIDTLTKLVKQRLEFSRLTIQSRKQNGMSEAQKLIATGEGEFLMEEISNTIDSIQNEENKLLTIRQQAHNNSFSIFNRSFFFLLGIIIIILIIAFFTVRHNTIIRIKSEEALKKSNELFYNLFEHNPAIIAISRISDGKLTNVNTSFLNLYGITSSEEVIGKTAAELNILAHPEQRDEIARQLKENQIVKDAEVNAITKRGENKWLSTSVLLLEVDNTPSLFSVSIDLTDRKKAEEQLKAVNKELEAFTYSVSHDLRAPLRIINGYAEILATEYSNVLDDEGKRLTGIIITNAKRMGQLIDDMLNFSRLGRTELNKQPVNMNKLVAEIINEQQASIKNGKVEIKISELPSANCDHNLIQQVWLNLISNAIKYSSKKEKAIIEIGSINKSNEIIFFAKDNGAGFDIQYADKLFGVFQRLHKLTEFEGTGVGLALVHRIITRHEGKVWAEAEPGKGATFYFSLPT